MLQIAIIGDIHLQFDERDVAFFNQSAYDLILCVGDLSNWRPRLGLPIARRLAQLEKPALFMPGNHDAVTAAQLLAEMKGWTRLERLFSWGQDRRIRQLQTALGQVMWGGYGVHPFGNGADGVTVITARPQAMGGSDFSFVPYLARQYGIHSLAESAERLKRCVDAAAHDRLIFLAHNGPTGLGSQATDIWGCDFLPQAGDFGDEDLRIAIEYARQKGKRVLAVIAGHMHHHLEERQNRRWYVEREGLHYLNAARVPRIFHLNGAAWHHHVSLTLDGAMVRVQEQWIY